MSNVIQEFLQLCKVLDTESTGLCPLTAEICEVGVADYGDGELGQADLLIGTKEPIPFLASAKNNISRSMLAGLPTFEECLVKVGNLLELHKYPYMVAHNAKYDRVILQSNYERAGFKGDVFSHNRWICTYRLSKQLFPINQENPDQSYSLSYLRYCFDLKVHDNASVHRAGDDAYVCARLLEYIAEYVYGMYSDSITTGAELGELLYELSSSLIEYDTMNFGKHKGRKLRDVAESHPEYLLWALDNMENLKEDNINFDNDLYTSIVNALEAAV